MYACWFRGRRSALKPIKKHFRDQYSFLFRLQEAETMPFHCSEQAETLENPRQDHQRGKQDKNCCNCGPRSSSSQGSTPATEVNTTKISAQNDCERDQPKQEKRPFCQQISWPLQAKALVSVLAISLLMTAAGIEASKVRVLDKVYCICYPVQFRKDIDKNVLALLDSGSKVNAMTPAYMAHLSLKVIMTIVGGQKIDGFS